MLEILISVFILTVILTGSFLAFGAFTEKAQILVADGELRARIRYVEALLRTDIERAVKTDRLEWYQELDGITGPRFIPEPFADFGWDGLPNEAEPAFQGDPVVGLVGSQSRDPNNDDFYNPAGCINTINGIGCLGSPWNCTERNGIFDPGEYYFDIDKNGRYTGEPYLDNAIDQNGAYQSLWDPNGVADAVNPFINDRNYRFDSMATPVGVFRETWPTFFYDTAGNTEPYDIDRDRSLTPTDEYLAVLPLTQLDPTRPEDNPLTFLVDERLRAIDGSGWIRTVSGGNALNFDRITANFVPLSPFGFFDVNYNPVRACGPWPIGGLNTTANDRFDPNEVPLYDYFGGIVNAGDQDTLYLRTRVELGGQMVEVNVYYRLIFQNTNLNYSEQFTDNNGNRIWDLGVDSITPAQDLNGNGVPDPIVDPSDPTQQRSGERRLQRLVFLPGSLTPILQDLGPAIRFNIEYWDAGQQRFLAPFSDTGNDGLFDSEENPPFSSICGNCPDFSGDNFVPGRMTNAGTENNGVLDLANISGLPAGQLNKNPFLVSVGSGIPFPVGENPFEGIKRFGYPDSAGTLVLNACGNLYPLNAREQIPLLGPGDPVFLEPIGYRHQFRISFGDFSSLPPTVPVPGSSQQPGVFSLGAPLDTLFFLQQRICDGSASAPCPVGCPANQLWNSLGHSEGMNQFFRFSPAGVFGDDGWLRCAGVSDSFANLKAGDQVFVWAFALPPRVGGLGTNRFDAKVPVPPGYYTVVDIRGNRLLLDLSAVPGGAPASSELSGVPAIYRAPYLPPSLRIDFALEGQDVFGIRRELRPWSFAGPVLGQAGTATQGTASGAPVRGMVLTLMPGSQ